MRIGSEYWATATNRGSLQPVFQLMRSSDLVNWHLAGAVFTNPPRWATESWWAPHLVFRGASVLLYYSAKRRGKEGRCIGVASAPRPRGPWRDQGPVVCRPGKPLDPTTVQDERGRSYLVYKADFALRARPLSVDGTAVVGGERILLQADQPWENGLVEAPQIVRRGRTYTLLYSGAACCGKTCTYALGAAQSRSPLGPYRKLDTNPILQSSRMWRCPGHAGAVTDDRGATWLLYHAYPSRGIGYVARQTLLDRLRWRSGVPVVGRDRDPSPVGAAPAGAQRRVRVQRDDFLGGRLSAMWQWEEDRRPGTKVAGGTLGLVPRRSAPGRRERLFFGTTPTPAFTAETSVVGGAGGIGAYWTPAEAVGIERVGDRVRTWQRKRGRSRVVGSVAIPGQRVSLRLSGRYNRFTLEASPNGRSWRPVGPPYSASVTDQWAFGTGLALTAATPSRFDWVSVRSSR